MLTNLGQAESHVQLKLYMSLLHTVTIYYSLRHHLIKTFCVCLCVYFLFLLSSEPGKKTLLTFLWSGVIEKKAKVEQNIKAVWIIRL